MRKISPFLLLVFLSGHAMADSELPDRYEITGGYDGELWRGTGDALDKSQRFLGHSLWSITLNGATLINQPGLSFFGSALFTHGQVLNDEIAGAAQGTSNIEAPHTSKIYEAWFEWMYGDNSLKVGLYDVNSEFDAIDTASLFINPSHGIGPDFSQSGLNGPSIFPTTSLGIRSWHQRGPLTLQFAALDAVSGHLDHPSGTHIHLSRDEGALLLGELGWATEQGLRFAIGHWQYTAKFDDLVATDDDGAPIARRHNQGTYGLIDMNLRQADGARAGWNVYARYGQANDHINAIRHYLGMGVVATGLIPGRASDLLGVAYGAAHAGDGFRELQTTNGNTSAATEQIVELTYLMPINEWLTLQPDAQHIRHPGFAPDVDSLWALGLRISVAFNVRN